jgi:hypothetical protein
VRHGENEVRLQALHSVLFNLSELFNQPTYSGPPCRSKAHSMAWAALGDHEPLIDEAGAVYGRV